MKKHQKVFLVVIALMALGISWTYFSGGSISFTPEKATGSAIDEVRNTEKKNRKLDAKSIATDIDLDSKEVQELIQNTAFRKLILNENFRSLLESPTFIEFTNSLLFFEFVESAQLSILEKSPEFSGLTQNPQLIELVQHPLFFDLMENSTLIAVVRNSKFVDLEKMTLESFK